MYMFEKVISEALKFFVDNTTHRNGRETLGFGSVVVVVVGGGGGGGVLVLVMFWWCFCGHFGSNNHNWLDNECEWTCSRSNIF